MRPARARSTASVARGSRARSRCCAGATRCSCATSCSDAEGPCVLELRPILPFRRADALTIENQAFRTAVEPTADGFTAEPYAGLPALHCHLLDRARARERPGLVPEPGLRGRPRPRLRRARGRAEPGAPAPSSSPRATRWSWPRPSRNRWPTRRALSPTNRAAARARRWPSRASSTSAWRAPRRRSSTAPTDPIRTPARPRRGATRAGRACWRASPGSRNGAATRSSRSRASRSRAAGSRIAPRCSSERCRS